MAARIGIAATWSLLIAARAASPGRPVCEARAGTACDAPETQLTREHALLQVAGAQAVSKKQTDSCASVRRRRRDEAMGVCRRRHNSGYHLDIDTPWSNWKCNEATNRMECSTSGSDGGEAIDRIIGWPLATGVKKAAKLWCEVDIPPADWNLKTCPPTVRGATEVHVLSYNLFWWNLFNIHHGSDRSAGRLINRTAGAHRYDLMGFQECDDVWRVVHDAGLDSDEYEAIDGGRAIAIAYRKTIWTMLEHDSVDVGEDSHDQYYGKRAAMWVRLQNAEGKTVFFMNHHGPLRVSQGGGCTGSATALNIMKVIADRAHSTDVIILVGDFNAALGSSRIQELERRLHRVHSGDFLGGIDHVFSNCGGRGTGETLAKGDGWHKSDHNALGATFLI